MEVLAPLRCWGLPWTSTGTAGGIIWEVLGLQNFHRVEKEHPLLPLSHRHLKVNTHNDFQSVRELRCLECVCFCLHLWQGKVRTKVDSIFDPSSIVDASSISHTCFFSGWFFKQKKPFLFCQWHHFNRKIVDMMRCRTLCPSVFLWPEGPKLCLHNSYQGKANEVKMAPWNTKVGV